MNAPVDTELELIAIGAVAKVWDLRKHIENDPSRDDPSPEWENEQISEVMKVLQRVFLKATRTGGLDTAESYL